MGPRCKPQVCLLRRPRAVHSKHRTNRNQIKSHVTLTTSVAVTFVYHQQTAAVLRPYPFQLKTLPALCKYSSVNTFCTYLPCYCTRITLHDPRSERREKVKKKGRVKRKRNHQLTSPVNRQVCNTRSNNSIYNQTNQRSSADLPDLDCKQRKARLGHDLRGWMEMEN
jgi:hypothetical protein